MYLFTREARLSGRREPEAIALAVHITEYCTQLTGVHLGLWANVCSQDVGTLVFTSIHPDLASLEATFDKLNVDNEYHNLVERAHEYVLPGTVSDTAWRILHEAEEQTAREVNYTVVVEGPARPGKLMAAVSTGIEMCHLMEEISGVPAELAVDEVDVYGRLISIQQYADTAEYERTQGALLADSRFRDALDQKLADVLATESTTRRLYRRIV